MLCAGNAREGLNPCSYSIKAGAKDVAVGGGIVPQMTKDNTSKGNVLLFPSTKTA